ncbi:Protein tyrosine kinase [Phytophthora infestans]|uniref:Protein tyrosine kinase n=1 Tax=Phytophthora infestans TaxID=4787 RepID=A0A8S9USK9_PHYIN|nr:Protein tyrosine kinase [Phytophthora infestans]
MPSALSLLTYVAVTTVFFTYQATATASTDFVDVYYQIYKNQASQFKTTTVKYEISQDIPDEVTEKVQPFGVNFSTLPDLLQRALIWDSGFAFGDKGSLAKVYTLCTSNNSSATMEDLALTQRQVANTSCGIKKCLTDDSTAIYSSFSSDCGPSQLNNIAQCACSSVKTTANTIPVWATGEISLNGSVIPETIIRRHTWNNYTAGRSALLFAIHTSSVQIEDANPDLCDSKDQSYSLTIPCIEYRASDDRWCRPKSSTLVLKWLKEYVTALQASHSAEYEAMDSVISADTDFNNDDNKNTTSLQLDARSSHWRNTIPVIIVGAAAMIVTGIAVFLYLRQRSEIRKADLQSSGANQLSMSSTQSSHGSRKPPNNQLNGREDIFGNPHILRDCIEILTSSPLSLSQTGTAESHASNSPKPDCSKDADVLNTLINDPQLKHAQIPFDRLQFHHLIARGAHEVWLCVLRDRCVAVKRLPKDERKNLDEIRAFIETIRLSAFLQHSSILSFIGVAWSSLQDLCLVTEYLELGDLQDYLRQSNPNRDQRDIYEDFMSFSLSWKSEKMQLLLDITRGLVYLHRKRIIHGDLKTRNVLLSADLDAKLTGFGVVGYRRENQLDKSHTSRPNTPFWTAPEVLAGGTPSRKADIYSLGILITELDTHRSPYATALTARGRRMPPRQVLQHIMSGHFKPCLSPTCPNEIVDLVELCLQPDPDARPSASDVVQAIRSIPGFNLDEFSL